MRLRMHDELKLLPLGHLHSVYWANDASQVLRLNTQDSNHSDKIGND